MKGALKRVTARDMGAYTCYALGGHFLDPAQLPTAVSRLLVLALGLLSSSLSTRLDWFPYLRLQCAFQSNTLKTSFSGWARTPSVAIGTSTVPSSVGIGA